MKYEIFAALTELAAGPFLRLRQRMVYRAMGLRAESTLVLDLIGAAARVLVLLAPFVVLPASVALVAFAVVAWSVLVALAEVAVVACSTRRV